MDCPRCSAEMDQLDMQDVPIERCPECNGIWLDAGELELISQRRCLISPESQESWFAKLLRSLKGKR